MTRRRLGKLDLFRVFLRVLFLQGLLNRRGMQNLGFASAVAAAGRVVDGDNALILRHLSFFNCNPNFTPLIIGGVLRLEEERSEGKPVSESDIDRFKKSLSSPLAAMGDMLFLGGLKPLALTFACIFAIYKLLIGLLAVFLIYNLTIISFRLWGVYFGYAKGWELVDVFSGPVFQRVLVVVQGLGAGTGGVLVGLVFHAFPQHGQWMLFFGSALTVLTLYLLKRDIPASWFAIILFPVSALFTLIFV
ncbi:MAG: PTS system mannose/fructose/sorbose family transporter subunit IID [Candidatus Krumholzibacteria bacterium]